LQKIQSVLISQLMSAYLVKTCFTGITVYNHTRSQACDLTHHKQTVCSLSYHGKSWSCSTLMGR